MSWIQIPPIVLRCVIPVVLSNNNNKLMVHMYIVKNTTIFLIVRLLLIRYNYMFRPSMLAISRLYMKHLTISYIYTWVGGIYICKCKSPTYSIGSCDPSFHTFLISFRQMLKWYCKIVHNGLPSYPNHLTIWCYISELAETIDKYTKNARTRTTTLT